MIKCNSGTITIGAGVTGTVTIGNECTGGTITAGGATVVNAVATYTPRLRSHWTAQLQLTLPLTCKTVSRKWWAVHVIVHIILVYLFGDIRVAARWLLLPVQSVAQMARHRVHHQTLASLWLVVVSKSLTQSRHTVIRVQVQQSPHSTLTWQATNL